MAFYSCLVRGLLVGTFVVAPLLEAQESQWQSLAEIRPGTKVQVVENSLKSTSTKFVSSSETGLRLKVEEKEVVIPRDQVYRVSVSGKNAQCTDWLGYRGRYRRGRGSSGEPSRG
jgi:outer membrane lipoprotein-sorting protein